MPTVPQPGVPVQPASHAPTPPQAPAIERAVPPSKRLQRVAEYFHSQSELLAAMREQFETEMEPMQSQPPESRPSAVCLPMSAPRHSREGG